MKRLLLLLLIFLLNFAGTWTDGWTPAGSPLATDAETVTGTATSVVTTPANITAKMAAPGTIGTVTASTNPTTITTAQSSYTFVDSTGYTHALPTGNLSSKVGFVCTVCHKNAGTTTIDAGTGNFLGAGGAGKTLTNSTAAETYANITVKLISSAASVNTWEIIGGHGTWVSTP